jgi:hypothetical protein
MAILQFIKKFVAEFVAPAEAHELSDTVAYHSQADDRELRFSRVNVLRRYY